MLSQKHNLLRFLVLIVVAHTTDAYFARHTSFVAGELVSADSATSGVEYFPYETVQLTSNVLAQLQKQNITGADKFSFSNSSTITANVSCKSLPGDASWPSTAQWDELNDLVEGALIEGVPSASVCYQDWPQYDMAKCNKITEGWTDSQWQGNQPTGIFAPLFEGLSCLPPTYARPNATCTLGGLPSYILNVTTVAQVQLAVNFARNNNIRLVVKNTGHDFNAKSTGAGALSIWTHFLQEIEHLGDSYENASGVEGPAFKVGSGITAEQLLNAADEQGVQVIGGLSRTVGVAGGFVLGGGNGPLISKYGMAADQILSMEAVLPDGQFVSVDENNYPDLFFALRGGGGGTWAIVTSMVIRAYPQTRITRLTYTFGGEGVNSTTFWAAVDALFAQFPTWPDSGLWSYWSINCANKTGESCIFSMAPQLAPDLDTAQVQNLSSSLFSNLSALGIAAQNVSYVEFETYLEAYADTWPSITSHVGAGLWSSHNSSRLFPTSNWEDPAKLASQAAAIRSAVEANGVILGYNTRPPVNAAVNQTNAVNPAWRSTSLLLFLGAGTSQSATPSEIAAASKGLVEAVQPWRDVSPGSGTYLNGADINEPDFQQSLYGDNYEYLYALKHLYDPWGLLWAPTAVGAEDWYITDQIEFYPTQGGRLCPA